MINPYFFFDVDGQLFVCMNVNRVHIVFFSKILEHIF